MCAYMCVRLLLCVDYCAASGDVAYTKLMKIMLAECGCLLKIACAALFFMNIMPFSHVWEVLLDKNGNFVSTKLTGITDIFQKKLTNGTIKDNGGGRAAAWSLCILCDGADA